jgi:hypothetical protein
MLITEIEKRMRDEAHLSHLGWLSRGLWWGQLPTQSDAERAIRHARLLAMCMGAINIGIGSATTLTEYDFFIAEQAVKGAIALGILSISLVAGDKLHLWKSKNTILAAWIAICAAYFALFAAEPISGRFNQWALLDGVIWLGIGVMFIRLTKVAALSALLFCTAFGWTTAILTTALVVYFSFLTGTRLAVAISWLLLAAFLLLMMPSESSLRVTARILSQHTWGVLMSIVFLRAAIIAFARAQGDSAVARQDILSQ